MISRGVSLALAFLILAAGGERARAADAGEVVAAERAFAADASAMGVKRAFLKWSIPEAIVLNPGPANAHEVYGAAPDLDSANPRPSLKWWPRWAGISRSGDLGFTTGAVERGGERRGHYFTVWNKQADGAWKWVYDGGADVPSKDEPGPDAAPGLLPISTATPMAGDMAMRQVRAIEAAVAARAVIDARTAVGKVLAQDARVHQPPLPAATSQADLAGALGRRASVIRFRHLGGAASKAGDLAWTYGEAAYSEAGAERAAYYVRIWQRQPRGWRLVFDQLTPKPTG